MVRALRLLMIVLAVGMTAGCPTPPNTSDDDDDDSSGGPILLDEDEDGWCNDQASDEDCEDADLRLGDCDDQSAVSYPEATEICDGRDNDCDGRTDEPFDDDQDGFVVDSPDCREAYPADQLDCNDQRASFNPEAEEICDDEDNDCDGVADDGLDIDGDGVESCGVPADCDDEDDDVYPGNPEVCDEKDNDCNGTADDGVGPDFNDGDLDGFSECAGDCDDLDGSAYPTAIEGCDDVDNDCDGDVDEDLDLDGDGVPGPYPTTTIPPCTPGHRSSATTPTTTATA